jgi:hypothetical protein
MLSFNDVNILGTIIDTTFGHSSTRGVSSIKIQITGETLVFTYHEICNIASDMDKFGQVRPIIDRAQKMIKERKAEVEKEFKRTTKRDLKLKETSVGNVLDPMGYNYLNPVRPTHFRMTATYEIR